MYDVAPPGPTHLLLRGNETTPGAVVVPGFLRVLSTTDDAALAASVSPSEGTSGRRLALALWLTDGRSPASALLARVMVNRIWQQLFGRGIVATPENFGSQGVRPTHPELLEWLADDFVTQGWKMKRLIKSMMLSTAYCQASHREAAAVRDAGAAHGAKSAEALSQTDPAAIDPANDLLWRMRLRRLESEAVRDCALAAGGKLEITMGGPSVPIQAAPDGQVVVATDKLVNPRDAFRRSVYLVSRRAYNLSLLTVFDQPLVATNCTRRDASAVPLQSLAMLNDGSIAALAESFAVRVETQCPKPGADERIDWAFRLALARRPDAREHDTCRELIARQIELHQTAGADSDTAAHKALVQLCHTLLNTSEFLYIE